MFSSVPRPPLVSPTGYDALRPHVERRCAIGITQGALAGAADWSTGYLGSLERGERPVSSAALQRYVDALQTIERRLETTRAALDELAGTRPITEAELRDVLTGGES